MAEWLVADVMVERLKSWGVDRVFGYSGDGINGFMGALRRSEGVVQFVQSSPTLGRSTPAALKTLLVTS